MIEVHLSWYEVYMAAWVGVSRRCRSLAKGRRTAGDASGSNENGWTNDIEGAAGEMAAAKAIGVYWSGSVDTFKDLLDVSDFEIRTRTKHHYELFVRPADPDNRLYLLVTGRAPDFRVIGGLTGTDAKKADWLKNHGKGYKPAYFVPTEELISIEKLMERMHENKVCT